MAASWNSSRAPLAMQTHANGPRREPSHCIFGMCRAPTLCRAGEILHPDRQCAHSLAGGGENRVRLRWWDQGRAGLADAAPFLAGCGGDVDFSLGRVFEAHDRVGVEVALLDSAVLDRDLAEQRGR